MEFPFLKNDGKRIFSLMNDPVSFFQSLYGYFNAREIESVLPHLSKDVKWANGMDGGFVYGRDEVKAYWTRQFKEVNSRVYPIDIKPQDTKIVIRVHQVVQDLEGKLLSDQMVDHVFELDGDKIVSFKIGFAEA